MTTRLDTAGTGARVLPIDTLLDGRYVVREVIAAGGFGITYLAEDTPLQKACAVKEHFPRLFAVRDGSTSTVHATDSHTFAWSLERFLLEAQSLTQCHHPSVVAVTDVFRAHGIL